jgi:hypothetical protein
MYGTAGKTLGAAAKYLASIHSPAHTKMGQARTPLAQYLNNEVIGTRMRRWERPIHDFLMPYFRSNVKMATGHTIIPGDVQRRRDLNTLADAMTYLRELNGRPSFGCRIPLRS